MLFLFSGFLTQVEKYNIPIYHNGQLIHQTRVKWSSQTQILKLKNFIVKFEKVQGQRVNLSNFHSHHCFLIFLLHQIKVLVIPLYFLRKIPI